MAKLIRYTSFSKLKSSADPINRRLNHSIGMSEFEEFIKALKNSSLKKSKIRKRRSSNGQKKQSVQYLIVGGAAVALHG